MMDGKRRLLIRKKKLKAEIKAVRPASIYSFLALINYHYIRLSNRQNGKENGHLSKNRLRDMRPATDY